MPHDRSHPNAGGQVAIAHTLTAADPNAPRKDGKRQDGSRQDRIPIVAHTLRAEGFDASEDGTGRGTPIVAYSIRADAMREGVAKTPSPDAEGRVRLRDPGMGIYEEMAPTLDAGTAHGIGEGSTVPRRLTPRECERLQAWSDDHTRRGVTEDGKTVKLADGPRYRMCGNGVTSSVVEWIGERIVGLKASR